MKVRLLVKKSNLIFEKFNVLCGREGMHQTFNLGEVVAITTTGTNLIEHWDNG